MKKFKFRSEIDTTGYTWIPEETPHFVYYGVVFEAPKEVTDEYINGVINQVLSRVLLPKWGELMFHYHDTHGIRVCNSAPLVNKAIEEFIAESEVYLRTSLEREICSARTAG